MSLQVDDGGRGRSRSPGGRRRERSRSPGPAAMEARESSYVYPEDDLDDRDRDRYGPPRRERGERERPSEEPPGAFPGGGGGMPYPEDESLFPGSRSAYAYDDRRSSGYGRPVSPGPPPPDRGYRNSREQIPDEYRNSRGRLSDDPYARPDPRDPDPRADPRGDPRRERRSRGDEPPPPADDEDKLKFLPQKYARSSSRVPPEDRERDRDRDRDRGREAEERERNSRRDRDREREREQDQERERERDRERDRARERYLGEAESQREKRPTRDRSPRPESPPSKYKYADPKPYEYAQVDPNASRYGYDRKPQEDGAAYGASPYDSYGRRDASPNPAARRRERSPAPGTEQAARQKQYYGGGGSGGGDPRESANVLTVEPGLERRGSRRDRSPQPPTQRMSTLSVAGAAAAGMAAGSLSAAPGSPLLESYHGTYQDMSPMPSPLLLASNSGPNVIEAISPINSDDERGGARRNRRARFHDPEDIATRLANALKGHKKDSPPDTEPLIEILPGLSHEQVMELRHEYKALVKTGADRKGVNIAKHIRQRLKDSDPNLMKACYAVALGKWESEAYWANFWYQGDKTRRELLIESLMGRTNDEMRQIKDSFSDRKYDNSLVKCMKTELKEDKFKKAVLAVLEERRMEDTDPYGRPLPLDFRLVDQDVDDLRRAVKSEKGGESAMIGIVVRRSDAHLREVLKTYESAYRGNFARDALKKSGNLVGELLAHILNGVINQPVRDALLLNHALTASKRDDLRRELLISRLVRYHWDRHHMEAVKRAYRERYGADLQEAVREGTSGEWGLFCYELCIYRMPNDVKRVERVEIIR